MSRCWKVMASQILSSQLFLVFICVLIKTCYTEFRGCVCSRQSDMDDKRVSRRELWSYNLEQNDINKCGLYCMEDEACVSFYFNNETYVCTGHSIVLANMTHAEDEPGSLYFTMDCRAHEYIGTDCDTNEDCAAENSECDDGFCECIKGHAFWPKNRTCVEECTTGYGNDFTPVEYRSIAGNNNEAVANSTMEECKELCASATDFICRTFDFWFTFNYCLMSNVTRYTAPASWQWDDTARHFVRDCL